MPTTTTCPPWCTDHDLSDDPDEPYSVHATSRTMATGLGGPPVLVMLRHDTSDEAGPEPYVALGWADLSVESARQLAATLLELGELAAMDTP
jgi:hypothetical protein